MRFFWLLCWFAWQVRRIIIRFLRLAWLLFRKLLYWCYLLLPIAIVFVFAYFPLQWCWDKLCWRIFEGAGDPRHGYFGFMLWLVGFSLFVFLLARLFPDGLRKRITVPLHEWLAPEFPMQGIATAIFVGMLFAMIGFAHFPEGLRIFGWVHGEKAAITPYFAVISALGVAPVTVLIWYWRHVYKKRDREHALLTLATTSLADKDSPSVRITGLYALQELVETNPAKLIDVMNILCGFLKHRYHEEDEWYKEHGNPEELPEIDFGRSPDIREALVLFSSIWESRFDLKKKYRAAMEFAGKAERELDNYQPDLQDINFQRSNLSGLCLREIELININFLRSELSGFCLRGVKLTNANLQGADLRDANLQGAYLEDANLQNVDFRWAKLQGAYLGSANLQGAFFEWAKLQGADFRDAKLQGAYLGSANLQGADFRGAKLQGAYLEGANLQGANLEGACLQGAFLEYACLQGANLESANLQGAYLWIADLKGAELRRARVGGANFKYVRLRGTADQSIMSFSFAKRVGGESDISEEMREQTYFEEEIQPVIDELRKIGEETSDDNLRKIIDSAIIRLQEGIGKKPIFPDPDDPECWGELTIEMALDILKEWPEEMQREQLKILKKRGLID
jgi:uncharacterized protein YjbI with pentapeptide repeats